MMTEQASQRLSDASDLSQRTHRRLIGYLGLLLPLLLYILAGLRPTGPLPSWQLERSISAYYYTGAVAVFVGVLFAMSLFLFSYRGYSTTIADRVLGKLGFVAAVGVALFPTKAPEGVPVLTWWHPVLGVIHHVCAGGLFIVFILFSFWLFRKTKHKNRKDRLKEKKRRDWVYLACSVVMAIAVVWALVSSLTGASIFWQETAAIEGFAISWLVKGEAHVPVMQVVRRIAGGRRP